MQMKWHITFNCMGREAQDGRPWHAPL